MHSIHKNITRLAQENDWFRKEVVTDDKSQVMLMSLKPGEEIGEEEHKVDQTLVFVSGSGKAIFEGKEESIEIDDLFFIPASTKHNFINTGQEDLKLFTIYAPPEHKAGTNHRTKDEAVNDPNEQD